MKTRTYYIEWKDGTKIGMAVAVAEDVGKAIERVTESCEAARFDTITVVGVIDGIKVINTGILH